VFKKSITSIALGLLVSTFAVSTVNAGEYESSKSVIEDQIKKPIEKGIINDQALKKLETEIKDTQSFSSNLTRKMSMRSNVNVSSEYLLERESNDDFGLANSLSYEKPTIGQLMPLYDIDFHKIVVPNSGILLVGGTTNSYSIDLLFLAVQKDFVENSNLVYLGSEYDDGIEVQAYQAKPGTYYVGVIDGDNDYYDNNTEEDLYVIATDFVDNVAPAKPTVNKVDNNDKVVTGKTEAGSTVIVKVGNTQIGSAKATSTGTFSVKISPQKAGVTLTVYAKDSAGNTSAGVSTKVIDVLPPSKPVVNKVDNNDKVVTGKAEANSTVTVKVGSKVLGTAKATSKGTFSVSIATQKANTKLTITSKDSAGNVSPSVTITVTDVIPPSKPTVNRVDSNDKVVTGKAEANSTVTVKVGTKTLGSVNADSKGNYSVKVTPQKTGTVLSVKAKDKAGNSSAAATAKVVKP
jgi:hypothetical protein